MLKAKQRVNTFLLQQFHMFQQISSISFIESLLKKSVSTLTGSQQKRCSTCMFLQLPGVVVIQTLLCKKKCWKCGYFPLGRMTQKAYFTRKSIKFLISSETATLAWTYGGVISFMLQFLLDLLSEDVQCGLYGSSSVQYNLLHRLFRHMKVQLGKYLPVHMQKQAISTCFQLNK